MLTQSILAKVEGLLSGAYTVTMIRQEPEWLSGYVSNGDGQRYATTVTPTLTACSCPDFMYRARAPGYVCKHQVVLALYAIRNPQVTEEKEPEEVATFNVKLVKTRKGYAFAA